MYSQGCSSPQTNLASLLPNCSQELLVRMQELSDDTQRLTGAWGAATGFRTWNQCPATAADARPLATESFRYMSCWTQSALHKTGKLPTRWQSFTVSVDSAHKRNCVSCLDLSWRCTEHTLQQLNAELATAGNIRKAFCGLVHGASLVLKVWTSEQC